ncbi:sugar ABC transporter ATP-binding protein [Salinisphaera hydrothermalis]|uniref:Autoinducer 2 import ATP-binding protein LsrA n=1 Tax=Salinisphaera hydrothermalis (strain C41B8) TaxID=1304275 RepID=A0A084IM50_SALHC|nr:sugar ABC transporter ATP-binding protein [Salinisphaera hydrothermalis]KEZ77784.1 ribose transport ATP-binding protein RbsA [Salinisphaera hydrothermalis C41B8]
MSEPILECLEIGKRFGTTPVLSRIDLRLQIGRVTALMGENGAGKSTLLNIIAGLIAPTTGELRIDGEPVREFTPSAGQAHGIQIVTQELSLVPHLTVADNIFLGRELTAGSKHVGYLQSRRMFDEAQAAIDAFGVPINARDRVEQISLSYAQIVEIIRAYHRRPRILLLDEPTSSLTSNETQHLFDIVDKLRADGTTVVFTTHKMDEVERMADDIAVLRDGEITLKAAARDLSSAEVVNAMVGRKLAEQRLVLPEVADVPPVLAVEHYATRAADGGADTAFDFAIRPGEIIGLAGIAGAGRTAFLKSVYGLHPARQGRVRLAGADYADRSPSRSLARGLIYIPESRKEAGLVLSQGIAANAILANLGRFSGIAGWLKTSREHDVTREALEALRTKYESTRASVAQLSGGNQQKALVARCLIADDPKVLLLDEPTRGIDVGAKADIYEIIVELARHGVAIVVSSSELPELMTLSHRIAVFKDGFIARTFERDAFQEADIVRTAIGA